MGLDQYLTARKYIGNWEHTDALERIKYRSICREIGLEDWNCEGSPSLTVEVTVAYWRKANQIHGWFVENVQDGNDDCHGYYVSREQLIELRDLCNTVLSSTYLVPGTVVNGQTSDGHGFHDNLEEGQILENPAVAKEKLPNTEGFFFGGQGYDQWYWRDLENTVKQIDGILETFSDPCWDFEYRASW